MISAREITRRIFLKIAVLASGVLSLTPFFSLAKFLSSGGTTLRAERRKIAEVDELKPDEAKVFSYPVPEDPKRYPIQRLTSMLIRLPSGEYRGFNAVCTHLQCIAKYKPKGKAFTELGEHNIECPCHAAVFRATDGVPIAGPPFLLHLGALPVIELEIDDDGIYAIDIKGEIGVGRSWK